MVERKQYRKGQHCNTKNIVFPYDMTESHISIDFSNLSMFLAKIMQYIFFWFSFEI